MRRLRKGQFWSLKFKIGSVHDTSAPTVFPGMSACTTGLNPNSGTRRAAGPPSQGDRKSQGRGKPQYISSKKRPSRFVILSPFASRRTEILRFAQDDNPDRDASRSLP